MGKRALTMFSVVTTQETSHRRHSSLWALDDNLIPSPYVSLLTSSHVLFQQCSLLLQLITHRSSVLAALSFASEWFLAYYMILHNLRHFLLIFAMSCIHQYTRCLPWQGLALGMEASHVLKIVFIMEVSSTLAKALLSWFCHSSISPPLASSSQICQHPSSLHSILGEMPHNPLPSAMPSVASVLF